MTCNILLQTVCKYRLKIDTFSHDDHDRNIFTGAETCPSEAINICVHTYITKHVTNQDDTMHACSSLQGDMLIPRTMTCNTLPQSAKILT